MKSAKKLISLASAAAIVLSLPCTISAKENELENMTFDDMDLGVITSNWTGNNFLNRATGPWEVKDDCFKGESGKSLWLPSNFESNIWLNLNGNSGLGEYEISFDFNMKTLTDSSFDWKNKAGNWFENIKISAANARVYSRKSSAYVPIEEGNWYHMRFYLNTDDGVYGTYVDDTLIYEGAIDKGPVERTNMVLKNTYIDNFKIVKTIPAPEVTEISARENSVHLKLSRPLAADTIKPGAFKLLFGGEDNPIESAELSENGEEVILTAKYSLYTAAQYVLAVDETLQSTDGAEFAEDKRQICFKTDPADFDVLSVDFKEDEDKLNVFAVLCNKSGENRTAVMILVLKNSDGVITDFYASAKKEISENGESYEISAADAAGKSAEVFFIDGWGSCIPVKNYIYKK